MVTNRVIHWIEIYPVDSAIQLLNNWGQFSDVSKLAVTSLRGTKFNKNRVAVPRIISILWKKRSDVRALNSMARS